MVTPRSTISSTPGANGVGLRRHAVSRADLVRLIFGASIAEGEAANLTGFFPPEPHASLVERSVSAPLESAPIGSAPSDTEERPAHDVPLWRALGPVLRDDAEEEPPRPDWLDEVPELARVASSPEYRPLFPAPLVPWSRLGRALRRLLCEPRETPRVDTIRLVSELARCRPLRRMPRKKSPAWAPRLQVYWDQATAMQGLWHDQYRVVEWLRRWRGERGLELLIVDAAGRITPHTSRRKRHASAVHGFARAPDAGTSLLALSDLGSAHGDPERIELWTALARRAKRASARACALVLAPIERWYSALTAHWSALEWEHPRVLRRMGPRSRSRAATTSQERSVDRLLVLLSPAVRIEPALLRDARILLGKEADLGTELDAWMDPRVLARSFAGMTLDPAAAKEIRAGLAALRPELRAALRRRIELHHRLLSPLVLFEELDAFPDDDARADAERGYAGYARRLDRAAPGDADRSYVERLEARQDAAAWQSPALAAVWALANRTPDGRGIERPLPEGLNLEDVLWALRRPRTVRTARLWQRGPRLAIEIVRSPAEALSPEPGSLLAELPLRYPELDLLWRSPSGERRLWLGSGDSFELPDAADPLAPESLYVASDLAELELHLQCRPVWAETIERARRGLWVSCEVEAAPQPGSEAEEPQARRKEPTPGLLSRIFKGNQSRGRAARAPEPESPPPPMLIQRLEWPTWARALDRDRFGWVAELDLGSGVSTRLRWVPAGRFRMGSAEGVTGRYEDEGPEHWVTLSAGFWLGESPCTQAEWRAVTGTEPSDFKGEDLPVEQISWEDCRAFCEKLSRRYPGLSARLPTEAEWEYACRAGTQSAYSDGSSCTQPEGKDPALEKLGWYRENSGGKTHPVRALEPNAWGLYDVHGNVWQWCEDWYGAYTAEEQVDSRGPTAGSGRVVRGGGWNWLAQYCRSACRNLWHPAGRLQFLGFRFAAGQPGVSGASEVSEHAASKQAGRSPAASRDA